MFNFEGLWQNAVAQQAEANLQEIIPDNEDDRRVHNGASSPLGYMLSWHSTAETERAFSFIQTDASHQARRHSRNAITEQVEEEHRVAESQAEQPAKKRKQESMTVGPGFAGTKNPSQTSHHVGQSMTVGPGFAGTISAPSALDAVCDLYTTMICIQCGGEAQWLLYDKWPARRPLCGLCEDAYFTARSLPLQQEPGPFV